MSDLRISRGMTFPEDAVTQTFGILAKRGSGKSNTAAVMAEQMFEAKLPFVVIDPVGAWWGLRSSKDGKGPGLAIPIFGGYRGDVPLEQSGAKLVADLIVDEGLSCVLDVSAFESENKKRTFLAEFAEHLFRIKGMPGKDDPLHLFLEEADDYAPQKAQAAVARCLGAFQRIVKQGRARGLGSTMITQRSAVLNKDLLTQIETLIVLRTTSPQDRKAISDWIEYHAMAKEVLESLSTLEDGEAWVWSPQWLGEMKRIKVNRRSTFDSGATPELRKRRSVATLADVDLDAIRAQMEATIERGKENDPAVLKRRIEELEGDLANAESETADALDAVEAIQPVEPVEVPVLDDDTKMMLDEFGTKAEELIQEAQQMWMVSIEEMCALVKNAKDDIDERIKAVMVVPSLMVGPVPPKKPVSSIVERREAMGDPLSQSEKANMRERVDIPPVGGVKLKAGARRMLEVLARTEPVIVTVAQWATLSGLKKSSGTWSTYVSILKREAFVWFDNDGNPRITDSGVLAIGWDARAPRVAMTTEETQTMWLGKLKAGARRMLEALINEHPDGFTKERLAKEVGISVTSGTFSTYLSTLKRNGLIEVVGEGVYAADVLFLGRSA